MLADVANLSAGTELAGRYRIEEKIGDGAVASVYRAQDQGAGHSVALKIIDPLRSADPVGLTRFEREFEVLAQLDHPGIARALRRERLADLDVIVLELVEGETLAQRLEGGRIPVDEAVLVGLRLAEALQACHRSGVLHRDLKPANIMLHPSRGPVILDFGLAWFSAAANLTRTGALVGTPQYTAPEAFSTALRDGRADIYSLGAMLFEMLAGRPVHLADNVSDLVVAHLDDEPPLLSSLRPEVSGALAQVVARAIAPRVENRFATAGELAEALRLRHGAGPRLLQESLRCPSCTSPQVLDLPICPGCGREVDWQLTSGRYAAKLDEVPRPDACARWLYRRYRGSLKARTKDLQARLRQVPVPLVVGASRATAEQLAAQAREQGCEASVLRGAAILGARFRVADATVAEIRATALLHAVAVFGIATILLLLGVTFTDVVKLPAVVALLGLLVARSYTRRPLLRCQAASSEASARQQTLAPIATRLGAVTTEHARQLAASAVARAAPLLMGRSQGLPSSAKEAVEAALDKALNAAEAVDAQTRYLQTRSRTRLAAELDDLRQRVAHGDGDAAERLAALEQERETWAEASRAHDVAARQALEACEVISATLRTRTTVGEVGEALAGR